MVFPKTRRLTSNQQFKSVLDRGRRAGDSLLTLYAVPNERGHSRLGISVGRASGNAVVRNRLKRLLREAFRLSQDRVPAGFDYVLLISPGLSRKLKRPSDGDRTLRGLGMERMRQSLLSLAATAARTPVRTPDRTHRQDHPGHE